ncbi:fimbria/pilus periplasmic chaperone [Erwinia sorbitola]|uniref:Fimbria/pilus periplasmic chaperone n=1 Tax=Erwinia sorbitola TaxID=2681984 RepID=A0A6I6ENT2_9GAMM|nr:fimbria/pilus periplasmic chaperone [Erwinia sorbitola]QGU85833.1 fimbria/pilus periplasmic chaperone [Erwinia sorbitola]
MFYKINTAVIFFILLSTSSMAAMTISGTRVIFPGDEKEVTVRTTNKGDTPALVQVWVDDGNANADVNSMKVPYMVTPPVYRVEPGKGQSLRLIYNNMVLPKDRESISWLNMLEIPPAYKGPAKDRLELAFRTRIKIFYRPKALDKSSSASQTEDLKWAVDNGSKKVKVTNPTPYYFSFDSMTIYSGSKSVNVDADMVAPFSTSEFDFEKNAPAIGNVTGAEFKLLNDYGAIIVGKLKASGNGLTLENYK